MSQEDIMRFLDRHPDTYFTSIQLVNKFKRKMNRIRVFSAIRQIVKREEYTVEFVLINGRSTMQIGRRKENHGKRKDSVISNG